MGSLDARPELETSRGQTTNPKPVPLNASFLGHRGGVCGSQMRKSLWVTDMGNSWVTSEGWARLGNVLLAHG